MNRLHIERTGIKQDESGEVGKFAANEISYISLRQAVWLTH